MATEAALLGRPSAYVSPLRFGSMLELERRFGLLQTIENPADALSQVETWLSDRDAIETWTEKRARMLKERSM